MMVHADDILMLFVSLSPHEAHRKDRCLVLVISGSAVPLMGWGEWKGQQGLNKAMQSVSWRSLA